MLHDLLKYTKIHIFRSLVSVFFNNTFIKKCPQTYKHKTAVLKKCSRALLLAGGVICLASPWCQALAKEKICIVELISRSLFLNKNSTLNVVNKNKEKLKTKKMEINNIKFYEKSS